MSSLVYVPRSLFLIRASSGVSLHLYVFSKVPKDVERFLRSLPQHLHFCLCAHSGLDDLMNEKCRKNRGADCVSTIRYQSGLSPNMSAVRRTCDVLPKSINLEGQFRNLM